MSMDNGLVVDQRIDKLNYIQRLFLALHSLWGSQEILKLNNVRVGYLHYFFAFPFALIFVNIQDCLLASNLRVFGLPSITVTFISFAIGATAMFALYSVKNIHIVSRFSSVLTLIGFIPWLFLPDGYPSFICAAIFMAGIGGCMANSGLSFMFVLNNAERFFGCVFMALFISSVKVNSAFIVQHSFIRISLISILVVGISVCMYKTNGPDFAEIDKKSFKGFDPSIWLSLYILLSYFIIRILGFYVPQFQIEISAPLRNMLAIGPSLLCIIIQLTFHRSVWTMCNIFFISAIMSYVMGFARMPDIAYVFYGMKEIGLFVGFYLFTCVVNKFCDFRLHKIAALICILTVGAVFVVPDLLIKTTLTHPVAVIVSSVLFTGFLLLSPSFSLYLFSADWSQDFAKLYMSEIEAQVALFQSDDLILSQQDKDELFTPEERDVALLLIEGETQYSISRKLHRPAADINRQLDSIRNKVIRKGDSDPGIAAVVYEYKLTRREADMLRCLCRHMTNAEIAAELLLSEETVRTHVRNLMKKLPMVNRQDITAWVHELDEKIQ